MKVCLRLQLDKIKLRLLKLFLYCSPFIVLYSPYI